MNIMEKLDSNSNHMMTVSKKLDSLEDKYRNIR